MFKIKRFFTAQAFDNSGLASGGALCNNDCNVAGFTPALAYVYDAVAKTVTVTNSSTIPSGDVLKAVHLKVHDQNGGTKLGEIIIAVGGSGYTSAPAVTFTGGGGTGAAGTAVISGGVVTGVTVTAGGSGYSSAPTVVFTGGGGADAKATATVASNAVTAITMVAGGNVEVIDVSTLATAKPLNLTATILTTNHIAADGSASHLQAAGTVGYWNTRQNA